MRKDMFRAALVTILATGMLAGAARAGDIYVSTNGLQQNAYANWTDAFTNLQAALDYSAVPANGVGNIYLAGNQTFSTPTNGADATSLYVWQNATNVALRGGYRADPVLDATPPGLRDSATYPTVLRRLDASGNRRVLRLAGVSNAVIEQVTIREGRQGTQYAHGSGLFVTNSQAVTISDCSILFNTIVAANSLGAGVGVQRSDVVLTNCTVANNYNDMENSGAAGLYVDPASRVTMVRSFLRGNRQGGSGGNTSYGAGFYNRGDLRMLETVVATNVSYANNALGGGGYNTGILLMQNCLVVSNKYNSTGYADGIHLAGGTAIFVNCTIVSNAAVGVQWGAGAVAMTNCIVWGHSSADLLSLPKDGNGVMTGVWYSNIGDGGNKGWQGCLSANPLFADTTYYHLQSTAGNYTGGYFSGGSFAASAGTSPLIDRGPPPPYDYSREPAPNGSWVNMGYDGNTEAASKSPAVSVVAPSVANYGAATVGHRSAMLRGEVTATGGELPQAWFRYWVSGSGTTNEIAAGYTSGYFERSATGLTPGTTYEYLVAASNSAGETVSGASNFTTHAANSYLYVATNGNNTAGTNWVTAYQAVQTALNLAEQGDTIYLAGHTFVGGISGTVPGHPNNAFLIWRNATNIAIRGGYDAEAGKGGSDPGTRNSVTELKRTVGAVRVLTMSGGTNCTIEQVTIRDGASATIGGGGVYFTNCLDVTFSGCVISNNVSSGGNDQGAGLCVDNGCRLVLTNSTVVGNRITATGPGTCRGGGIAVLNGGRVTVVRSLVTKNSSNTGGSAGTSGGGGFQVIAGGVLELYETVLNANTNTSYAGTGGAGNNFGTLLMRNCLVSDNYDGKSAIGGLALRAGAATLVNCTIANNGTNGVQYAGGTVSMTNCIVWGHKTADLASFPGSPGTLSGVWYSSIGDGQNNGAQGCKTPPEGPRFANSNYFHLASVVSNYSGGYFSGGTWTTSLVHSALIDAGDPNSPTNREPQPNGGRINMGYDGNTEVASLTFEQPSSPPAVTNLGALYWGHRTATLRGEVTSPGFPNPQGFFRYWPVGGATSETARAEQTGVFSAALTGLSPGQSYQYVAVASNSSAEMVSEVKDFVMHPTPSYLYVATNGNDTAGTNWATAYATVQRALDLAEPGDTIYLAGHTFAGGTDPVVNPHPNNAFLIWRNATNVTVRGGYDAVSGGGSEPGTRSAVTELKRTVGAGVRVLSMIGVTNCTLDQVTIRDGSAGTMRGVGVYVTNSWAVTFANCTITNNGGTATIAGAGLYAHYSGLTLTNSLIANNLQVGNSDHTGFNGDIGGGLCVGNGGRVTVAQSVLRNNQGDCTSWQDAGGGFSVMGGGWLELYESVLQGNFNNVSVGFRAGGAGANLGGTLLMRNCLVNGNLDGNSTGPRTDGILMTAGASTMVNCTIASNNTIGLRYSGGTAGVTNSIIWGHTLADATNFPAGRIGYSALAVPNLNGVNGCITNHPLFVGAATNDYRLQTKPVASPAIDAGWGGLSGWMLGDTDLAGERRVQGGRIDMGAYESVPTRGSVLLVW